MKIANEQTLRQFDRFSEELFRKKAKTKTPVPNPISGKFRFLMPLALMAGGLYLVHKNTPTIRDLLLEKEIVTYQQLLASQTVLQLLRCRWEEKWLSPRGKVDARLPTELYTTKLESDYLYLAEKRP
jgi:hypothetical protein